MSSLEEDPKEVARKERKTVEVERGLRQFLKLDGPKGNTRRYLDNYEATFGNKCEPCDGFGAVPGKGACITCNGTGRKS